MAQADNLLKSYDAVQDFSWALLYEELDSAYPNSKFVLTPRNEEAWFASMVRYFGVRPPNARLYMWDVVSTRTQDTVH